MTLYHCVALSLILLAIGVYGMLTRPNFIGVLLSIEVIMNAANLNVIGFAHFSAQDPTAGALFPVFVMAVSACEMAVALAILIALFRGKGHLNSRRPGGLHG